MGTNRRNRRIAELQRQINAADKTGQAYCNIADTLRRQAGSPDASSIEREVWLQEIARYEALVDEMTETSVSLSCDLAEWEQAL